MKLPNRRYGRRKGQSMTEYIIVTSMGLLVFIPVFSMLSSALMKYLSGVNTVLNFPLPL